MAHLKFVLSSLFALGASALEVQQRSWVGWESIRIAFIFGDSYSKIGFDPDSTQPSVTNPLGNPAFPSMTSSDGPNWVNYLTTKYNVSTLFTYDFAFGGATVDADLVPPRINRSGVLSVKDQVQEEFLPLYTGSSPKAAWTGDDSIFMIWIGINDIDGGHDLGFDDLDVETQNELMALVGQIYDAGGRNFFFINVPPINRSPHAKALGAAAAAKSLRDIGFWNYVINEVLDKPILFPETAGYKNLTDCCVAYEK
ncbi:hypothetical protein F5Y16DRAFT_402962 [Xylariaceae sp. FL0255]|nr:hypothetical protein F5Y16DRAFT_402962 [Xylariaceae sp. FL0255]